MKDVKLVSSMSSLAMVVKGKKMAKEESESDLSDCDLTKEEYALLVSNAKRFAKKNFRRFKNKNRMGNYSSDKPKDESFKNSQKDEENKRKSY